MIDWLKTSGDTLLTAVLMFTILATFFMVYVSKEETKSFEDQINGQLAKFLPHALDAANAKTGGQLKSSLRGAPLPQLVANARLGQATSSVATGNSWLFRVIILVNVVLVLGYMAFVAVVKSSSAADRLPIASHWGSILVMLVLVGAIEVVFFMQIASKYIPTPPSFVVTTAINTLKSHQ